VTIARTVPQGHSAGDGAATSTADAPTPSTRERHPRRSMTFRTTIRIAYVHRPCCLVWRGDDLRFV
jgi:hypothetical protein